MRKLLSLCLLWLAIGAQAQQRPGGAAGNGTEGVSSLEEKGREDGHADERSQSGGKDGAEDAHVQGDHKQVVQQDIGQAPGDHGGHGALGGAVVAHKAQQQVVEEKGGGKEEKHPDIGPGHLQHRPLRPQQQGQGTGEKEP